MGQLDDATRRRIAAIVLAIAIVVGTLAIADVGPFSNPPTAEERAQAAVEGFFAAANDKDYGSMCGDLTTAIRQQVVQRTVALLHGQGDVNSCGKAIEAQDKLLAQQTGQALSQTRVIRVTDSRVSDNRAAVDVELAFPGSKHAEARTFQLELVAGRWQISGPIQ